MSMSKYVSKADYEKAQSNATNCDRETVLFIIRNLRARLKRSPGLASDLPLSDHGLSVIEEALAVSETDTRLSDALDDVKRLHEEKMKFFERTIELERELATAKRQACTSENRTTCSFAASAIGRSIEDTVTLPKEPPEAWFRPFIMCPADEVSLAWQAFLQIAKSMRGSL